MNSEEPIWKRIILVAIITLVVGSILAGTYLWYELKLIAKSTPDISTTTDQVLLQYEDKINAEKTAIKNSTSSVPVYFSAPTPPATKSSNKSVKSITAPATYVPAKAPRPLTAEEQARLNSITAPSTSENR